MPYFKRYCTLYTSKLFQLFHKNLIVNFWGQNWLIPYIVLSSMYYPYFVTCIISSLKRAWAFIGINFNSLDSRMFCANFDSNWLSDFWEEDFKKILSMYFCYFVIISPWKRAYPLIWRKLNALPKGYIVPSLVEIGPLVQEEMKMWKVYGQTDRRTYGQSDEWSDKLTWTFSSGELKEKWKAL